MPMYVYQLHKIAYQLHEITCHPMKGDVTYLRRVCESILQDIMSQIYEGCHSDHTLHLKVHKNEILLYMYFFFNLCNY